MRWTTEMFLFASENEKTEAGFCLCSCTQVEAQWWSWWRRFLIGCSVCHYSESPTRPFWTWWTTRWGWDAQTGLHSDTGSSSPPPVSYADCGRVFGGGATLGWLPGQQAGSQRLPVFPLDSVSRSDRAARRHAQRAGQHRYAQSQKILDLQNTAEISLFFGNTAINSSCLLMSNQRA